MSSLRVTPLVCPDCSSPLFGLRYDKVFMCMNCRQGLEPGDYGFVSYPLQFAAPRLQAGGDLLFLPMWRMELSVAGLPDNDRQARALDRLPASVAAWATGFSVARPSFFGDLGLVYTESAIAPDRLERPPARAFVAACSRSPAQAARYAELFITLMLDKKADVTGLALSIKVSQYALWAIPFFDQGDKIVDAVTSVSFPAFAMDDLEDLRRIAKRRR